MSSIQIAVDVVRQHRWLPMRRECTCGWHQRSMKSGLLNHPHHVADVLRSAGAIPVETEQVQEEAVSLDSYDSRADTLKHSQRVGELMIQVISEALQRSTCHDRSKTEPPEVEVFNEMTPKLAGSTYGSDEYWGYLKHMKPGLDHHYAANRHHPEHFSGGVNDMTLVDLMEMLADWKAATERHDDGSLARSLTIQKDRFSMSDQLTQILANTARNFGWLDA